MVMLNCVLFHFFRPGTGICSPVWHIWQHHSLCRLAKQPGAFDVVGIRACFLCEGRWGVYLSWISQILDDPVVTSNTAGTLCYATAGPNTRTTQLFVNYGNNSGLDSQGFAPFGVVLDDGLNVMTNAINAQYGEQPDQDSIYAQGNAYLQQNFPQLTYLIKTTIDA
jgi:hypothetical protein